METVDTCLCQGCQDLRGRFQKDRVLLHFYARQLLLRGWAGSTDDVEAAYLGSHSPWYKAAQERGRRMAQAMFRRGPKPQTELASAPAVQETPPALRLFA